MALTEVLSSGGFTVVTDYFFQFKANGEVDNWFGTPSNPVNNLITSGWYTNGNNLFFFNLQTKEEERVTFLISTDGNTLCLMVIAQEYLKNITHNLNLKLIMW
jgi:hypothetical protein